LVRGSRVRTRSGVAAEVEANVPNPVPQEVFNLEIEVAHQYYVSDREVLAHNVLPCPLTDADQALVDANRLSVRSPNQIGATNVALHHIATIYEGNGNWASKFTDLFDKAGYSLEDGINKIPVEGHVGPHDLFDELYHRLVYDYLTTETQGLEGEALRGAFTQAMQVLRSRVVDVTDILNFLITH